MKIVGIIVEYNPLHNGHIYHIEQIKRQSNADLIIAIMSSTFTMRGDLSLFDKFTKTKQALQNSIDIVIELPMALGMHKADIFALHAISFLKLMNIDEIWIGSEKNDSTLYEKCFEAFQNQESYIEEELKKGKSYKEITDSIFSLSSNDLLGYSYYKAIRNLNLSIKLNTIERVHSNYLDTTPTNVKIASALTIRSNLNLIKQYTPTFIHEDLPNLLDEEKLFSYIKYKVISTPTQELKKIFFVDEGIEHKLKDVVQFSTYADFIKHLTSKRYTSTRIKRMLVYILCNISKDEMNLVLNSAIQYVRVLGYSLKGKAYLSSLKKQINIYTNIREGLTPALDIELRISKLIDSIYHTRILEKEQKAPILKD